MKSLVCRGSSDDSDSDGGLNEGRMNDNVSKSIVLFVIDIRSRIK